MRRILAALAFSPFLLSAERSFASEKPNVLLMIADDWGFPHAGVYGDKVVKTPTFDKLAKEGVLFTHAFVSSPSCTPSRSALVTGQYHWRLEEGANLHGTLNKKYRSYSEILADNGYVIGHSRKAWGPGRIAVGGRTEDPGGPAFKSFDAFLAERPKGKPFCYWFGSPDPHRPYQWQSGPKSGMDLKAIKLPGCFPDNEVSRTDVADYYWEVQRFDKEVGDALAALEKSGEMENTIVVVTGDHGMPFPRGKSNLYDLGCRVPLVVRWGAKVKGGRSFDGFVSLTDLAPTFLEAAGVKVPADVTGRSVLPILADVKKAHPNRDRVVYGKERHVPSQEKGNLGGYPGRAIRTTNYLYIRNYEPDRWPNGIPDAARAEIGNSFADCDNGPLKSYLMQHREDPAVKTFFDLAFAKRPAEELYDLQTDPEQLTNIAGFPKYADARKELWEKLEAELKATSDPRASGKGSVFETYPYYGTPQKPK